MCKKNFIKICIVLRQTSELYQSLTVLVYLKSVPPLFLPGAMFCIPWHVAPFLFYSGREENSITKGGRKEGVAPLLLLIFHLQRKKEKKKWSREKKDMGRENMQINSGRRRRRRLSCVCVCVCLSVFLLYATQRLKLHPSSCGLEDDL